MHKEYPEYNGEPYRKREPVRILMLSWEYPPHIVGGLGKHVTELTLALAALGVEVHVVTPNLRGAPQEETPVPNLWIHRVPSPEPSRDGADFVSLVQASNRCLEERARDLIKREGPFDLVHVHDWLVSYSGVSLKYTEQLPLVATMHGTERGRQQGYLETEQSLAINGTEWWLAYEASQVITVSNFMALQISQYFSIARDKIEVIANGVTRPSGKPLRGEERQAFRRQYANDEEQIIFSVSRIVYEKGLHILIDAAPQILARYGAAKFVIAGTGEQLDGLRQRAGERGVYNSFYFTGFVSDIDRDRLYQVADVAVFPSLYEPFGIVALEAMAYRCPVVVSATGGLAEVVKLYETGLTCYPGNPDSLAWAVLETLQHPEWAKIRALNAYREVGRAYNWSRIAKKTLGVYRHVAHAQTAQPSIA